MRGRARRKRFVVRAAAVTVIAAVALVLLSESGLLPLPGRPPKESNPDPIDWASGGPGSQLSRLYLSDVHWSDLDVEVDDPVVPVDPENLYLAAGLGAPDFSVSTPDVDELGRGGGDATHDAGAGLVSLLLVLIGLKAARDQGQDRRLAA